MTDNKKLLFVTISVVATLLTVRAVYLLVPSVRYTIWVTQLLHKQGMMQYWPYSVGVLYPGLFWLALAGLAWAACYMLAKQTRGEKHEE